MTFGRYRQIFRLGSFRRFWLAFSFSVLGDAMTRVALTWFVYDTTGSARDVGWLLLCYTGPVVVGGLLAGTLLDRFDRRTVMAADNLVRGLAVAAVPVLHAFGALAVWHVYVVAAIYGLLMMISLAGGPSLVPDLVPQEQLPTANALEMLSFTLGGVIGPPLAGLLIGAVGAPYVVVLDALSYLAFAGTLVALPRSRPPATTPDTTSDVARYTLGDAVRLLHRNPILLSTTLMFMAFNVGNGLLMVTLPVLVDRHLHGGAGLYGALLGVLALGEVVSSTVAGGVTPGWTLGTSICAAQVLSGLSLLSLTGEGVWLAGAALALFGACSAPLTIWAQTLRMRIIPERLRGRTFALLRTIMQGGGPLGGGAGGLLLPILGVPAMILLAASVVGLPGLAGARVGALRHDEVGAVGPDPGNRSLTPATAAPIEDC
jgi:MFS family permease